MDLGSTELPVAASAPRRIAVIAVHGVADQVSGDTARSVASLLINSPHLEGRYALGATDTVIVPAPVLSSIVPDRPASDDDKGWLKALRQSARSDFQREEWTTDKANPAEKRVAADRLPRGDGGLAFTDYLLFKAKRNGTEDEAYEMTRIKTVRAQVHASAQEVDVHEMYWADLSRLSGAIPRILTELFTMVFRLSRLGRDTVDQARRSGKLHTPSGWKKACWSMFASLQAGLDWAFSAVLANLFFQLLLVGGLIFALGASTGHPAEIHAFLACALPIAGLLIGHYLSAGNTKLEALCVAAAALLAWGLAAMSDALAIGTVVLVVLGIVCNAVLRIAEARFPAVRPFGLALMLCTTIIIGRYVALAHAQDGAATGLELWQQAAMRAVECLLLGVVAWWGVATALLLGWFVLGEVVSMQASADRRAAVRASVATGRLGLFVSIASFLILTMACWALLTGPLEKQVAATPYCPQVFKVSCDGYAGDTFLQKRYENSTESFSLIALLMLSLAAYLALVLVPSILAELKAAVGTSVALGRWLSNGYRRLDPLITFLVGTGIAVAVCVATLLVLARFGLVPEGPLASIADGVAEVSKNVLAPLVIGVAGIATAFSAIGKLLSRYVPGLRGPLDVALDVDNHFREFPRRAIPRAKIFSRYVGVLEHIAAQHYDRIVIVSHSQGTVITTELLRYLKYRASLPGSRQDPLAALWRRLEGKLYLLTAGCPLRQLYAARFPHLYQWVLDAQGQRCGPRAAAVGVNRWINTYTTGDYVGRWLWCDAPPAVDLVDGQSTLYTPYSGGLPGPSELDVCLGRGAHTHYFEQSQHGVAQCIDSLVDA